MVFVMLVFWCVAWFCAAADAAAVAAAAAAAVTAAMRGGRAPRERSNARGRLGRACAHRGARGSLQRTGVGGGSEGLRPAVVVLDFFLGKCCVGLCLVPVCTLCGLCSVAAATLRVGLWICGFVFLGRLISVCCGCVL